MSIYRKKLFVAVVSGVTVLAYVSAFAKETGIIKTVRGQVQIERGSGKLDAKIGDQVKEGDRVLVVSNSSLGIRMTDETLLSIGQNSTFVINRYDFNSITREGRVEISLLQGTFRCITGLIGQANPSAIKFTTPGSTIGIRGTDFIVEVPYVK